MARRSDPEFDALLDAWARWLADTSEAAGGSGLSLLARWMDAKGLIIFGGGGGPRSREPADAIERRVELVVGLLAKRCPLAADVLRLEYAAGWWQVAARRQLNDFDPRAGQLQKALALGVSVRTYRQRLADARAFVAEKMRRRT